MILQLGRHRFDVSNLDEELIRGTIEEHLPLIIHVEEAEPGMLRIEAVISVNKQLLSCTSVVQEEFWNTVPACREIEYAEMARVLTLLVQRHSSDLFIDDYEEDLPGEW